MHLFLIMRIAEQVGLFHDKQRTSKIEKLALSHDHPERKETQMVNLKKINITKRFQTNIKIKSFNHF